MVGPHFVVIPTRLFRDACLNREQLHSLTEARVVIQVVRNTAARTRVLMVDSSTLLASITAPNRAEIHVVNDWRDYFVALTTAYPTNDPRYEFPLTALVAPGSQWGDTGGDVFAAPGLVEASYLENARELLDEPGEWYADAAESRLYYIPLPGEDPATVDVVIPTLQTLLRVQGTSASSPVRNLEFVGLRFEHATWTAPNGKGIVPDQGAEFQRPSLGYFPGAVEVKNAAFLAFRVNRFARVGATALLLSEQVADSEIVGNVFTEVAESVARGRPDARGDAGCRRRRTVHLYAHRFEDRSGW